MPEAVIVDGVRTPFVKAAGPLNHTPTPELGRLVVRELLYRTDLAPEEVDELIAGNVASPPEAANVARVIALRAGIPIDRVAHTVNRNCASGFECLTQAVERIQSGQAKCIVAVGADSMSNIPVFWSKRFTDKLWRATQAKSTLRKIGALLRFRPSDLTPAIGVKLGLTDPVSTLTMGDTAEKLAREFHITREEQDQFALRSHQRAAAAWKSSRLADEVMAVYPVPDSKPITTDVGFREEQSIEALAKMRPFFDPKWGSVTVGNSCMVTDGAVALLVMEASKAKSLGLKPIGRIRGYAYAGCDPSRMGLGPVYATARAMKATGLRLRDMELVEINEAFAAQVLACLRAFKSPSTNCSGTDGSSLLGPIDPDRLNVNGGAIALGHPVGATGARLVLTLLRELARQGKRTGLATLCVGGGQGGAMVVDNVAA
jgi:acetyl-CoA C-acetyltransferase/acetyl-CoA acyltransferase